MALKGKPIAIGTSDTTIYTCPATTEASIHGLVFANNTGSSATITLKVYIQSLGTTTTVATGITVAANSTYTWPKPIDVNAGDYIQAAASTGSAIVCLYSTYEGGSTPAAVGFTPRGAWSSGSSYATNDVVSYNGSSYLAIQASTNQTPSTATAYWLVLASKGDTGAAGTNGTNGTGDVNGPSSSVDSELALFDATTGKLIKRATLTGIVKATSGVASQAVAGTDYVAPGGAAGAITVTGLKETKVAVSASDIDLSTGNYFTKTISGATTFTVSNVPTTGTVASFILELTNPGSSVTWWSGVKWVGGTQPTWTGTGKDVLAFYTHDGGTTWNGFAVGKDVK